VRNYTQTIHRTTQNKHYKERHKTNNTKNDTKQTVHRTTQNTQYTEHRTTQNTQYTEHRTIQNTQYTEQQNNLGRVRAVPHLCELYPGICITTGGKTRGKKTCQGNRRVPAGMMKIHKHTIRIHRHNNKNYINYSVKLEYNHICTDIKKQNLKNMK
jgi:hypothetical protein